VKSRNRHFPPVRDGVMPHLAGAKNLTANDPQATLASAPRRSSEQDTLLAVALDGSRDLTNEIAAMRVARL
jgi:hypothetical protein